MAALKESDSKTKPDTNNNDISINTESPKSPKSSSFKKSYNQLLHITEKTSKSQQQTILTSFVKQHADTFDFKQYDFVTEDSNTKLFKVLTHSLITNTKDFDLQTAIFQTIRVLSRSKTGIHVLMEEEFHKRMIIALKSYRRKLIVQTLAVMANLCFMDKDKVTSYAKQHKTYKEITDILTNKDDKFKKKKKERKQKKKKANR
eukprot:32168_1